MTPDPAALHRAGRHEEALAEYRRIATLPDHHPVNVPYNIAVQLNLLGRHQEALRALTTVLARDPKHYKAWRDAADNLDKMVKHRAALTMFNEALKHAVGDEEIAEAHHNISRTLWILGPFDECVEHARKAVLLDPHNPMFVMCLGELQLVAGQYAMGWQNYDARLMAMARAALPAIAQAMRDALLLWGLGGCSTQIAGLTTEHDKAHIVAVGALRDHPIPAP